MKYDVFICYSSQDQKVVEGLLAYLENNNIRCFAAYRDIPRGMAWARAIVEALDSSKLMVVIFSDTFNNSEQVDREIEIATENKMPIITFRITDSAFKGAKKYYLNNINWIDAFPAPERAYRRVADNIKLHLERLALQESKKEIDAAEDKKATPIKTKVHTSKKYMVGDFYDVDDKKGIVFNITDDGLHGKIVSLYEAKYQWCTGEIYYKELLTGATHEHDGSENQKVIQSQDIWRARFPAFAWCSSLGKDWYLPSIEELSKILLDKETHASVNAHLRLLNCDLLPNMETNHSYWSSTEVDRKLAKVLYMNDGAIHDYDKYYRGHVRAVAKF